MPDISIDRITYIKIGNSDPLTTGIADGTMLIDRVLFAQDFLFGQFASSMFEIQIYGIANVAGQKIEVYQKENDIRTDLFVGQIESSKLDNAGYYRDIIAYDKFYFISKKNVADWFNGLWTNNTEISVLDAYKSLLAHFDIDYDPNTVTAANFSGTLHKDSVVSFEKISFKDMVKYLLEPLGLIPYINESGKGAVFSPSMANTVDLSGKYDVNQSVFEEFTVKPMQWVGIQNIDSAILQQAEITGNTSDIRYDLSYNPIRLDLYVEDGEAARTAVLTNFTNKANFTEYKPCEVFMIVSDMSIKIGDKITTTRGTAYVSEIILSGPMLVEQQLISRGSQVQQEVEEEYDPVFAYLDNRITETADDLQQQLDDFEPSEEYLEKVGEFSDTIAGGMGLQVITYKAQDGSLLKYFYAPPPAGSAVTGISGSNFIFTMKSTGFAWTNKWEGAPDASSESHVDPGTGDTVSTQWTSGISKDGNALLKILNAYKVSADILEGGELVIKDPQGNVIHKFSYDDYSAQMGGPNGISYNASTGKTTIGSDVDILGSVTIGGTATIGDTITNEVEKAVDDLVIKDIDHTEIKYASDANNTTAPTPESVWVDSPPNVAQGNYLWTRTVIYYSDNSQSNPSYSVARQGSNGTSVSISSIKYAKNQDQSTQPSDSSFDIAMPTLNPGDWLWTKTTYSDNSTAITKTYIGTDGDDGDSVLVSNPVYDSTTKTTTFTLTDKNGSKTVTLHDGQDGDEGEHVHFAWADNVAFNSQGVATGVSGFSTNNANGSKKYMGTCANSEKTDPGSSRWSEYSWTLVKGADGSDVDHYDNAYAISTNGTQPPEDDSGGGQSPTSVTTKWYCSLGSQTTATSFKASYENNATAWYGLKGYIGQKANSVIWSEVRPYLYTFDRTDYADGTYQISNFEYVGEQTSYSGGSTVGSDVEIERAEYYVCSFNTIADSTFTTICSNYETWNARLKNGTLGKYVGDLFNTDHVGYYIYKVKRVLYKNGSGSCLEHSLVTDGSSSAVIETGTWYYAYSTNDLTTSTISINWVNSRQKDKHAKHFSLAPWNSTNPYLYTLTAAFKGNASKYPTISDLTLVATYGESYPPIEGGGGSSSSTWQSTPPDTSQYKGQYLWTRTTVYYTSGAEVVTYSVAYIGTDGTNGRGISSTAQYYYATATDTATLPTVGTSSWKSLPSQLATPFSQSVPYLWSYTQTNYTSGNPDRTTPAIIGVWGQNGSGSGTQGRGIVSITPQYALTTSNSTSNPPAESAWSETMPPYSNTSGGERQYYWQRDLITYDKADSNGKTTQTTQPVILQGVNAAMLEVNELNSEFAAVIVKESNQTYVNGAKIYTGSVTTGDIAAYNALIKNLMANTVDVDGNITITSPSTYGFQKMQSFREYVDDYCVRTYTKDVSESLSYSATSSSVTIKYFNPSVSGTCTFKSTNGSSSLDPVGYVYDSNGTQIATNDDTDGRNFSISFDAVAGTTYRLGVKLYSSGSTTSGTVEATISYKEGIHYDDLDSTRQSLATIACLLTYLTTYFSNYVSNVSSKTSKLVVQNTDSDGNHNLKSKVYPVGLLVSDENTSSLYGTSSRIGGSLYVAGDLSVGGRISVFESGQFTITQTTSGLVYMEQGRSFSKTYSSAPKVFCSIESDTQAVVNPFNVTDSQFSVRIEFSTYPTQSTTHKVNYLVVP